MTLRSFLISVCLIVALALGFVLYTESRLVLGQSFKQVEQAHTEAARDYAATVISAQKYLLGTYAAEIERANRLGRLFLERKTAKGGRLLEQEISELKNRSKMDFFRIVPLQGQEPNLDAGRLKRARSGKSGYAAQSISGETLLLLYFPVKVFELTVAVGVIGSKLNEGKKLPSPSSMASAIRFFPASDAPDEAMLLTEDGNPAIVAFVFEKSEVAGIRNRASLGFLVIGGTGLLALVAIVFFGLQRGFARHFESVVAKLEDLAVGVEKGQVKAIPEANYPIREVTTISSKVALLSQNILSFQKRIAAKSRTEAKGEQAEQLAHDLKGPVAALSMALETELKATSDEGKRAIRDLLQRISGVASGLSVSTDESDLEVVQSVEDEDLLLLVDSVVSEKSFLYSHTPVRLSLEANPSPAIARVDRVQFQRALANLIDNSIQAVSDNGCIQVSVTVNDKSVHILVSDNGNGMTDEQLRRLGTRGFSFGKENGSGLGVWHAKQCAAQWRGSLEFESTKGQGTRATMILPMSKAPKWIATHIDLPVGTKVVICDDDEWVHKAWSTRLAQAGVSEKDIIHFLRLSDLATHMIGARLRDVPQVLLCDYDLKDPQWTGLQVIEELGVAEASFLITSLSSSQTLRDECARVGVRLLPKSRIHTTSIVQHKAKARRRGK